jgi:ABC-type Zn uptake system ZnuABC Zn-binding protein ZnuA
MQHRRGFPAALASIGLLASSAAGAQSNRIAVLTAVPPIYSIAAGLARGTSIDVRNVPEDGRRINALVGLLSQRGDRFADQFAGADAVVTMGKLWREDPLFTAARMANVRVVDIDATKPWSTTLEGISVAMEPEQRVPWSDTGPAERRPSIFCWLSPANGARMAEIIAQDLMRLSPADGAAIERNLRELREALLGLKLDYELKLAELADVTVFALASEFVYLTTDMGLYVDGYFLKQDIDWTDSDAAAFENYLRDNAIGVVIHKWEPDARILAAIEQAGARLVVLDPIDAGIVEGDHLLESGYIDLLRADLESLYTALRAANEQR